MCGLTGFFQLDLNAEPFSGENRYALYTNGRKDTEDLMSELMQDIELRGGDGCGVTTYGPNSWTEDHSPRKVIHKEPIAFGYRSIKPFTTWTNFCSYMYGTALRDAEVMIGHSRKGSSGGKSLATTHPMTNEDNTIQMCHNGTLVNWKVKFTEDEPVSDTAAIVRTIEEEGAKAALEGYEGPMTLVWINLNDNTFNIHKAEDRPLYHTEYEGYMYFASEAWMLYRSLDKCGADMSKVVISEFKNNVHRSWDLTTKKELESVEYTPKPKSAPKESYACSYNYNYNSGATHTVVGGVVKRLPNNSKPWDNVVDIAKNRHGTSQWDNRHGNSYSLLGDSISPFRKEEWAIVVPYTFIKTQEGKYKATGWLDDESAWNKGSTPVDVQLFNVSQEVKDLCTLYPQTKLLFKIVGKMAVPLSRSHNFKNGFVGLGDNAIPFHDFVYTQYEKDIYGRHCRTLKALGRKLAPHQGQMASPWVGYTVNDVIDTLHQLNTALDEADYEGILKYMDYCDEGYVVKHNKDRPEVHELLLGHDDIDSFLESADV